MSNRDQWKFPHKASEVRAAAEKKLAHHQSRLGWWEDKKKEVMEKIKAEGLEIDESLANQVSSSYSRGPTVQVRNDLMNDLTETVQKVKEHRGKAEGYDAWVQVLAAHPAANLDLDHKDWLHFFSER